MSKPLNYERNPPDMDATETIVPAEVAAPDDVREVIAATLLAAADEIDMRGWTSRLTQDADGNVCAVGGILAALGSEISDAAAYDPTDVAYVAVIRAIADRVPCRFEADRLIDDSVNGSMAAIRRVFSWNDWHRYGKDLDGQRDVPARLREIAAELTA